MLAALTALFKAVSAAAYAYAKSLELKPFYEIRAISKECEELEAKIEHYRALGGNINNQLADGLRDKLEARRSDIKYLRAQHTDAKAGDSN